MLLMPTISADVAWHRGGDPTASVTGTHDPMHSFPFQIKYSVFVVIKGLTRIFP